LILYNNYFFDKHTFVIKFCSLFCIDDVNGLWIYEAKDRERVGTLLQELVTINETNFFFSNTTKFIKKILLKSQNDTY